MKKKEEIKCINGNQRISFAHIGSVFYVYNGKFFYRVGVVAGMEGKLFHEYIVTKKYGSYIHIVNKKKKK